MGLGPFWASRICQGFSRLVRKSYSSRSGVDAIRGVQQSSERRRRPTCWCHWLLEHIDCEPLYRDRLRVHATALPANSRHHTRHRAPPPLVLRRPRYAAATRAVAGERRERAFMARREEERVQEGDGEEMGAGDASREGGAGDEGGRPAGGVQGTAYDYVGGVLGRVGGSAGVASILVWKKKRQPIRLSLVNLSFFLAVDMDVLPTNRK